MSGVDCVGEGEGVQGEAPPPPGIKSLHCFFVVFCFSFFVCVRVLCFERAVSFVCAFCFERAVLLCV